MHRLPEFVYYSLRFLHTQDKVKSSSTFTGCVEPKFCNRDREGYLYGQCRVQEQVYDYQLSPIDLLGRPAGRADVGLTARHGTPPSLPPCPHETQKLAP